MIWEIETLGWWWWSPASGVHIHFFDKSHKILNISNKAQSIQLKKLEHLESIHESAL